MPSRSAVVFPKDLKVLKVLGENITLAMKRRKITQTQLCERTGLSMPTLRNILRGEPSVSMGHYLVVLSSLGLSNDLAKVALDDEFGRKLQDIELLKTPRKTSVDSKNTSSLVYHSTAEGRR
ncbi:MAG: XRE family transcriptional regulator [Halomonas sp.]|nr:helix-turn-helix transcriptional regulator [Halomonas sp.]TVP46160.1 MAG: XRE family transcriptional regulator [Halomonas sp.]